MSSIWSSLNEPRSPPTPLHTRILSVAPAPQTASPIFSVLPGEVRENIFSYVLTDYPDPSPERRYASDTCYTRPSYSAPRRTDTALLQTCRAAYAEAWFLPFVLREQVHFLANPNRAPPEYAGLRDLVAHLRRIAEQTGDEKVEIAGLRVFAQMFKIEQGNLVQVLSFPGLFPRVLTLTVRHTDWWYWENDEPLRFEARWIRGVCDVLPASVREVRIELESTVRRKGQVDAIVNQMGERWFFVRKDGAVLYPDVTGRACEVSGWRGESTWHGRRWERDETEPGVIDYHVVSVPFRLEHVLERRGGRVHDGVKRAAEGRVFDSGAMRLDVYQEGTDGAEQSWEDGSMSSPDSDEEYPDTD